MPSSHETGEFQGICREVATAKVSLPDVPSWTEPAWYVFAVQRSRRPAPEPLGSVGDWHLGALSNHSSLTGRLSASRPEWSHAAVSSNRIGDF